MKIILAKFTPLIVLSILVSVAIAVEMRTYEVTITLTQDQADLVRNSRSGSAVIEFTKAQLEVITDVLPEFDFEEVTLTPDHLTRANIVVLELHVPYGMPDPGDYIRMDPQPSP